MADTDNLPDRGNQSLVDVIATGYEWECWVCSELNKEVEYLEIYVCSRCGEGFQTNPPEHCIG